MLDDSPRFKMIELDAIVSTNSFLRDYRPLQPVDITLVTAEYQTAGRGQGTNCWESERGKNLLFSLLVNPASLPATQAFVLSEAIALSIREAIARFIREAITPFIREEVTIKWPNDIYVGDCKIAGILIENTLQGSAVARSIIGCGVDVNQETFRFPLLNRQASLQAEHPTVNSESPIMNSESPILNSELSITNSEWSIVNTPISLRQLLGHDVERRFVLEAIIDGFTRRYELIQRGTFAPIADEYRAALYRRTGFHPFRDANGPFEAEIADVELSGHLVLRCPTGRLSRYAFKEVSFLLPSPSPHLPQA